MELLLGGQLRSWFSIEVDRSVFAWLVLLSIGFHVVTGDRDALIEFPSGSGFLGHYSSLGPGDDETVSGMIHEITGNCTKKFSNHALPEGDTIGIIFLPEVDESRSHKEPSQSTTCTLLEQVKQAMLLGCSALVVLALNPSLFKQLDGSRIFSKPLVTVSSKRGVETMKAELESSRSKKAVISPVVKKRDEHPAVMSVPKLTLWSTCGKSSGGTHREWEGTVCLGENRFNSPVWLSTLWQFLFPLIVWVYILITYRKHRSLEEIEDVEESLQRLAKLCVSKMPAQKYKKRGNFLPQESENCAICLDEFNRGQVIRMLPCQHHFHCACVDDWLIKRRTCPLCKRDIVDQRFHQQSGSS